MTTTMMTACTKTAEVPNCQFLHADWPSQSAYVTAVSMFPHHPSLSLDKEIEAHANENGPCRLHHHHPRR